jgi:hypothetical protein
MNASAYPWNIEIDVEGVTFQGPGMESEQEAETIKSIVESAESVNRCEVVQQ